MDSNRTPSLVRRYHDARTSRHYQPVIQPFSPLAVDVPIKDHPTAKSFAHALRGFGDLVTRVKPLADGYDTNAILLYDVHVERLGELRVLRHFAVANGKRVRLRQVHDAAAVRAAGMPA
jgi:hypothetical protein